MRLLFLGFGNVGRRLAEILADRERYPGLALEEIAAHGRFGEGFADASAALLT